MLPQAGNVLLNLALVPIVLCTLLAVVYVKNNHFRSVRMIIALALLASYSSVRNLLILILLENGHERQQAKPERLLVQPGTNIGVRRMAAPGTAVAGQKLRQRLQAKGQAMPPSQKNKSNSPRFPIQARTGPNSLASAIKAVGRARPNTPAEHARVRAYIKRVAKKKGWHSDIPDSWSKKGAAKK